MAKKKICPGCLSDMVSESLGWKCKKCRGFISLQDGKFYEYVEKPFMPPMTNGDRIRAMSDEELATDLLDMFQEICEDGVPGTDWMMHWLKQPAEDDNG